MTYGLFDRRAAEYAAARPTYPPALFEALAALAPDARLACDCGAGSGQAARSLAGRFERVVGADVSLAQLQRAEAAPGTTYLLADAERLPLPRASVDLITVAAAIHWFDLERFYAEARRVLRPGGVIGVFTYFATRAEPALQAVLDRYDDEVVGPFWDQRIELPRQGYTTLPFPFEPIDLGTTTFEARQRCDLARLRAFVRSWSGSQAYERAHGRDPLALIDDDLARAWGDPRRERELCWPLFIRCGRAR